MGILFHAHSRREDETVGEAHLAELSGIIALVFVYGLVLGGVNIWRHGVEPNNVAAGTPDPRFQRALAIYEEALGPQCPHVARTLENYAAVLRETGRGAETAKMEARAQAIRAKHAPDD